MDNLKEYKNLEI